MSSFETKNFGTVSYETGSVLEFPRGLPGFEDRRRFLALQFADSKPLVFLQSLEDSGLCFITLPILAADPEYRLEISPEDREVVGLPLAATLQIGADVLCLTVLSLEETGPTANLLAPVVVNISNLKAVQAIAPDSHYSHQQALLPQETVAC
ncbi:MAG TPA: flagellar assembly protein FliW [Bryobacteraceae bacterium]|jgi:flagellar assembly factor FliW|nr:flagellar assembly protein FliW [Bryobacteraceae bacterium]